MDAQSAWRSSFKVSDFECLTERHTISGFFKTVIPIMMRGVHVYVVSEMLQTKSSIDNESFRAA